MVEKVAVVTGANKGIGFAIVRGLCKGYNGVVYLTARNNVRGNQAVSLLNHEKLFPKFHQLDITDSTSIGEFKEFIVKKHGGIDLLVNNAAIFFHDDAEEDKTEVAEKTMFVNYFSLQNFCKEIFPILRDGASVVNISSTLGLLSKIANEDLREKFKDPELTVEGLSQLMQVYVEDVKAGEEDKWGLPAYDMSKVGVSALTRIQQKMVLDRNIKVNSISPGYVATDMTRHGGTLTPEQGAVAALHLALDAPDLVGQFLDYDCRVLDWTTAEG